MNVIGVECMDRKGCVTGDTNGLAMSQANRSNRNGMHNGIAIEKAMRYAM